MGDNSDKSSATSSNVWSFATGLVAIVAFVLLTVFLVRHYKTVNDTATILGIVVPVFGAALGVTIGYWTGNKTGQDTGENNAKQQVKTTVAPKLDLAEASVNELVKKIQTAASSRAGATTLVFDAQSLGATSVTFEMAELQAAKDALAQSRAAVDSM